MTISLITACLAALLAIPSIYKLLLRKFTSLNEEAIHWTIFSLVVMGALFSAASNYQSIDQISALQEHSQYPNDHALYEFGRTVATYQDGNPPIVESTTITFPILFDVARLGETTTVMILDGNPIKMKLIDWNHEGVGSTIIRGSYGGSAAVRDVLFLRLN